MSDMNREIPVRAYGPGISGIYVARRARGGTNGCLDAFDGGDVPSGAIGFVVGDGGFQVYVHDKVLQTVDDTAMTFSPTSGSGYWKLVHWGHCNVRDANRTGSWPREKYR
jgi:hypothetical protein